MMRRSIRRKPIGRAEVFLRRPGQACFHEKSGAIWAPRYRQATFGAFLTASAGRNGTRLSIATCSHRSTSPQGEATPIISRAQQGRAVQSRGCEPESSCRVRPCCGNDVRTWSRLCHRWPVSLTPDLPKMGLPPARARRGGCILSWPDLSDPRPHPSLISRQPIEALRIHRSVPRPGTPRMLCTNPRDRNAGGKGRERPSGPRITDDDLQDSARCRGRRSAGPSCEGRGFLMIGATVHRAGSRSVPGNNYNVFDSALVLGETIVGPTPASGLSVQSP